MTKIAPSCKPFLKQWIQAIWSPSVIRTRQRPPDSVLRCVGGCVNFAVFSKHELESH